MRDQPLSAAAARVEISVESEPAAGYWSAALVARPRFAYLAVFYTAYVLAAGLGQGLAIIPGISITFWPPAGIFLATLLSTRRPTWPWWVLTGCLAEMTCNALWFHNPVQYALVYYAANALEAMTGALLLSWYLGRQVRLDTLEEVAAFVVLAAGVAPIVGATVIAGTDAWIGKHAFATAWPLVWLGDASGLLVSTPLALVVIEAWRNRAGLEPHRVMEAGLLTVLLIATGLLAFKGYLPTAYVTMPALLWAAVRFQLKGAAASLAIVVLMTAASTLGGKGEFAGTPDMTMQHIVMLQTYLGISAVSALLVAALAVQYRHTQQKLLAANRELESRVAERTAELAESEQRLSAAVRAGKLGVFDVDYRTGEFTWDAAMRRLWGVGESERITLEVFERGVHPDDIEAVRAARMRALDPAGPHRYEAEYRVVNRKTGLVRWVQAEGDVISFDGSRPVRIVGTVQDITERKRSEAELAAAAERSTIAQQAAKAWNFETDLATGKVIRTTAFTTVTGYAPDDYASSQDWRRLVHPSDAERVWLMMRTGAANGTGFALDYRIRHKDGHYIWLHDRAHVVKGVRGKAGRLVGMSFDVSDQKAHEEQAQLLMREVNHRSKNLLGVVLAIVRQTAASEPKEFIERFSQRIQSLSASHDLLVKSEWKGVVLRELVRSQLAHFSDLIDTRISLEGPPVVVTAAAAQAIGMAIHELATNAGKYGALSNADGRVEVEWRLQGSEAAGRFSMVWRETGGPPVAAPTRKGFGSTVISTIVKTALDAEVSVDFAPSGFAWGFDCESGRVLGGAGATVPAPADLVPTPESRRRPGSILVVEDDALVGLEIACALARAGFEVLGPATTVQAALELMTRERCDAAVLDVNLGRETSEAVAVRLAKRGTPFVTVSGYARNQQPEVFHSAPFVGKPLQADRLVDEVRKVVAAA